MKSIQSRVSSTFRRLDLCEVKVVELDDGHIKVIGKLDANERTLARSAAKTVVGVRKVSFEEKPK
jgi:osmotically-inducible protein OsmY